MNETRKKLWRRGERFVSPARMEDVNEAGADSFPGVLPYGL